MRFAFSLRRAVALKCLDCSGEKEAGRPGFDCGVNRCPLYPYRGGRTRQPPTKAELAAMNGAELLNPARKAALLKLEGVGKKRAFRKGEPE